MATEAQQILEELKAIRSELDFIKEHIIELDHVMTDDDFKALRQSEEDLKKGKTKRLI